MVPRAFPTYPPTVVIDDERHFGQLQRLQVLHSSEKGLFLARRWNMSCLIATTPNILLNADVDAEETAQALRDSPKRNVPRFLLPASAHAHGDA